MRANRKVITIAVAGALAAPGLATAQAANVQIYAPFDIRVDHMKFINSSVGTISHGGSARSGPLTTVDVVPTCGKYPGSKMWKLNYDRYNTRTAIYARYSKIGNTAGAIYYYIAGPTTDDNNGTIGDLSAGTGLTQLALGVKHTF